VAALAAFAFLITYDNIVDYNSNCEFARHVFSIDVHSFPRSS
jgi:predicted small integral membrane protein